MKIDENEQITIWLAGNTGLRNPMRIQDGFRAFARSSFVGNLHEKENELAFMKFLNDEGIIQNQDGKDSSGSHARKWRLMFERYGLIYGPVKKQNDMIQEEYGDIDEITPFGQMFLKADTIPAMQECFLRALGVEQYWLPDNTAHYSCFRWILAIMLELEKRTGSSELSRIEFALWGHTTNPGYDLCEVVDHILDLRERRKAAPAKKKFDRLEKETRGQHYDRKCNNFFDYCDMNMRYLRISGVLQRKGRGLIINPSKHAIAVAMAKSTASTTPIKESFYELTNGAPLPTDNAETAKAVLYDLKKQMRERNILFDISDLPLTTAAELNIARQRLEDILNKTDELNYAADQKNKWREISDYMTLLINGGGKKEYDDENIIEVPKDETPAYLEWVLWRAALAIDHLVNKPYEIRGFRLDSDFFPVSASGGGKGDLYCEFEKFMILTEVTMSTSSRQEAMEGEPVRRHVSDAVQKYDKPVYGMFIAVRIDTNTAETFRHGVWYTKDNQQQRLNIVPLTLAQFQKYFEWMFITNQASPEQLVELLDDCARKRDHVNAPVWQQYILNRVLMYAEKLTEQSIVETNKIPYGIFFGTKIYDTVKEQAGCVVGRGRSGEYVLIAFEGDVEPQIIAVGPEGFEKGYFKIV